MCAAGSTQMDACMCQAAASCSACRAPMRERLVLIQSQVSGGPEGGISLSHFQLTGILQNIHLFYLVQGRHVVDPSFCRIFPKGIFDSMHFTVRASSCIADSNVHICGQMVNTTCQQCAVRLIYSPYRSCRPLVCNRRLQTILQRLSPSS